MLAQTDKFSQCLHVAKGDKVKKLIDVEFDWTNLSALLHQEALRSITHFIQVQEHGDFLRSFGKALNETLGTSALIGQIMRQVTHLPGQRVAIGICAALIDKIGIPVVRGFAQCRQECLVVLIYNSQLRVAVIGCFPMA